MDEIYIFSGGSFSLDPGAIFGMVPASSWGKKYKVNDKGRIRLAVNIPILKMGEKVIAFDSGLNKGMSEKSMGFFEVSINNDLDNEIKEAMGIGNISATIYSHLHFDHSGALFHGQKNIFSSSRTIVQESEVRFARRPNELSKGSYPPVKIWKKGSRLLSGGARLSGEIRIIKTGGHTVGHQASFFSVEGKKYIYPGDIFPSSFHVRSTHIPAIDSFPVQSLHWKKVLLKKVIVEGIRIIFPHDPQIRVATISGTVQSPVVNPEETT
jgi:glyoxylase-like metal-dependent hydrolase (beta-lactamase superfamily II)